MFRSSTVFMNASNVLQGPLSNRGHIAHRLQGGKRKAGGDDQAVRQLGQPVRFLSLALGGAEIDHVRNVVLGMGAELYTNV